MAPSVAFATSTPLDLEIHALNIKYQTGITDQTIGNIIQCESSGNQNAIHYNQRNGKVWSKDVGLFQLNDYYQQKVAENQGFDIYTSEGNLEYGLLLMKRSGLKPWFASSECWSNLALKATTSPDIAFNW